MFFLKVQTQWIIAPMGGYAGMNYECVKSAMWMSGIKKKDRSQLFDDLRIIEYTVLEVRSKQK